jgi:hypothetical protein
MSHDAWTKADPTACDVCGRDACEDHLPPDVDTTTTRPRLHVLRAADLIATPRPVAIVEGIAYADCLTVLVSESGIGKTFLSTDLAGAVSDGVRWHGRDVRQGSVVYFSYEGDALGLRLRALRDIAGRRLEHLYFVRASDPLSPRVTREGEERSLGETSVTLVLDALSQELATTNRPPIGAIVIDTVRASLSGSEDNSEHVAAYLRVVRRLMTRVPGAAAILAHHSGWQDGDAARKRERGSSAWRGNCDVTLYLSAGDYDADRGECPLTLSALKIRDAERPAPLHLIRRRVECDLDAQGRLLTSCIIEPDRRTHEDREAANTAAMEAEHRALDLKTLRTIADRPEMATSQDRIRLVLGIRKTLVSDSLSRLVRAGWVSPGGRNQPYQVTTTGVEALDAS